MSQEKESLAKSIGVGLGGAVLFTLAIGVRLLVLWVGLFLLSSFGWLPF